MQVSHAAREVAGEGVGGARAGGGEAGEDSLAPARPRPRPDADVTRDPPHCRPTELSPDTPFRTNRTLSSTQETTLATRSRDSNTTMELLHSNQ